MKQLISVRFKKLLMKLHNGEHYDFYSRGIIAPLPAVTANFPQLNEIFTSLKTVFQREDNLFQKSEASILTPEIARKAEMIVAYFAYFKHSVDIIRFSVDSDDLYAMTKLQYLIKSYIHIMTSVYSEMSGLTDSFLENCNSPSYKPFIELLGLTPQITRLKIAHNSFTHLYNTRSLNKGQISELGHLREIRTEVDNTFSILIDGINMAWINNELGPQDPDTRSSLLEAKAMIVGEIHQIQLNAAHRWKKKGERK